ncbi:MAG: hypothetical protein ACI9Z3_000689 [Roseivirga sp.]|jgi:hypothetical protein
MILMLIVFLSFDKIFKMQLSDYLFWDVDKATISFEEHKGFIIPRVFMRGTLEDVRAVLGF